MEMILYEKKINRKCRVKYFLYLQEVLYLQELKII